MLLQELCRKLRVCYTCKGRGFLVDLQFPDLVKTIRTTCPVCMGRSPMSVDDLQYREELLALVVKGWEGVMSFDQQGNGEPLAFTPENVKALVYCEVEFDAVVEAGNSLATVKLEEEAKNSERPPSVGSSAKRTTRRS